MIIPMYEKRGIVILMFASVCLKIEAPYLLSIIKSCLIKLRQLFCMEIKKKGRLNITVQTPPYFKCMHYYFLEIVAAMFNIASVKSCSSLSWIVSFVIRPSFSNTTPITFSVSKSTT